MRLRVSRLVKMTRFNEIVNIYKLLKAEWKKKSPNLPKCHEYLTQSKILLIEFSFLPTNMSEVKQEELLIARNILEIAVLYSIQVEDVAGFERNMAQLKPYYFDYQPFMPDSSFKYHILGLNLLFLLSENRVADFHAELELIPFENLSNLYIKHPLSLEQYLMEGCYNKIFLAKANVPSPYYTLFMDTLVVTIRNEIANCIDKAFEKIPIDDLAKMLYFKNDVFLTDFIKKKQWTVGSDKCVHLKAEIEKEQKKLPDIGIAEQVIEYARQLEMIV